MYKKLLFAQALWEKYRFFRAKKLFYFFCKKVLTFHFHCVIILTVTDAGVAQWQSS